MLGVSIRLFRPLVLKKVKAGGEKELPPKRELSTRKKEMKKEDEKAQRQRKLHFSKQTGGEKNNVFLQKRV